VHVTETKAVMASLLSDDVRLEAFAEASRFRLLRAVVERLVAVGQWQPGDPDIAIVRDAGYEVTRLAWVLRDLPVELVGRFRGDGVMRLPKPPRLYDPKGGRPPKRGPECRFAKPETRPESFMTMATDTANYGKAEAQTWDRVHPRLTHRSAWLEHDGELPVVEGTGVRLKVEHLSKDREVPPVWLWSSKTGAIAADVDRWWQGARPAAGRRPPPALGETGRTRRAHPGPGPPGVQVHPRSPALPGPCSPTPRRRSRMATRRQEPRQRPDTLMERSRPGG